MSARFYEIDATMKRASGPKTPAGKARSAKNARKHGLNTAPSAEDVAGWFNLILNNPAGAEEEPNSSDVRRDAALRLAIAEACYHRALYLVEAPAHKTSPGRQVHGGLALHLFELLTKVESLPAGEVVDENDKQELKLGVAVLKFVDRAARREQRLFQRYLSEARSKRKKALQAWCEFNRLQNIKSRNELNYNLKENI